MSGFGQLARPLLGLFGGVDCGAQKREKSRAALFSVAAYCLKSGGGGGI